MVLGQGGLSPSSRIMAIRVSEAQSILTNDLGVTEGGQDLLYINLAGKAMLNAASWNWFRQRPFMLDLVNGQQWIDLPAGILALLAYPHFRDTFERSLAVVSLSTLLGLRRDNISPAFDLYVVDVFEAQTIAGATGGPIVPQLEVYPTPEADEFNALECIGRFGWVEVVGDTDEYLRIPEWMDLLYILFLKAVARGMEEEDEAPMSLRLDAIARSSTMMDAKRVDATFLPQLGQWRGGAARGVVVGRNRQHEGLSNTGNIQIEVT